MRKFRFMHYPARRLETIGWKASLVLGAAAAIVVAMWLFAKHDQPTGSSGYTTGVFLGSALAIIVVALVLATSRHLHNLETAERRAMHTNAAVALVFDNSGKLILHFQDSSGRTSWPNYWVPPGGTAPHSFPDTARDRLASLVLDRDWPSGGTPIASTNNSRHYRRINNAAAQVPVRVHAYWFRWTDAEPFMPVDHELPDRIRRVDADDLPTPIPGYYPELIRFLTNLDNGTPQAEDDLRCWDIHDAALLRRHLRVLRNGAKP